jgi:hypothetical protein
LLSGKYSAADSERQIDDLDELVVVEDAFAADGARSANGFPATEFREVRFIAERGVPGTDRRYNARTVRSPRPGSAFP